MECFVDKPQEPFWVSGMQVGNVQQGYSFDMSVAKEKHLTLVAGARPNFMKVSSIVNAISMDKDSPFTFSLVHTGQHYDNLLSKVFFDELCLPIPDVNFEVGSGSHTYQTVRIMERFEEFLDRNHTDCVIVVGDVNSTMACTIVAAKRGIKVAHVEAGLESGDREMPEEVNRLVTDSVADFLFCTSEFAMENLKRRGRTEDEMFLVGNTMIDTLMRNLARAKCPSGVKVEQGEYAVCTLHRPSNVDDIDNLLSVLKVVSERACLPVYFPVHPRTKKQLVGRLSKLKAIRWLEPLSYLEFLFLQSRAKYVLTDSGGIQEETTFLGIPCLTLRENTERPETVVYGTNELLGRDLGRLVDALGRVESGNWKRGKCPPFWDGLAGTRIVSHLSRLLL